MFWGLSLKANKKYSQTVTKAFHVSQAALDISNSSEDPIQVVLTWDKHNYILCTLRKNKTEQVSLDLNFAEGDEISFTSQGNGNIHLAGYFMPNPEDMFSDSQSDSSNDDIEIPTKKAKKSNPNHLAKQEDNIEEEEDSDSDDEDEDDSGGEEEEDEEDDGEEEVEIGAKRAKHEKGKTNGVENGTVQNKQKKGQQEKSASKGIEKALQGGVKIEEVIIGHGQEAKSGKKVQVYYEGRLKSNNKMFDSSKQGPGFKFALGRGEVIRGWDIGVAGMKVGGKRKITCPPNMAYGARGSPPVIPPNSTLVFDVELKNVQ